MKLKSLYKRSTTGKISFWEIEVEENKFRTTSGFTDGLKVTSEWTICEGKSYNSSNEQALKQAKAIHKKKIELGAFEKIEDIDNPVKFSPMLAKDWNDYKDDIKYPIYSQAKLDGIRCCCTIRGMFTRNGKEIISAPHIFKSLKPLFEQNPDLILDGELYCDKLKNDFNKIISCVRKTKPTQEDLEESEKFIEYWIYDVPSEITNFSDRSIYLQNLILPKYCKLLNTWMCHNEEEVKELFESYIALEYEGQILRLDLPYENKRSKALLKDKDMVTDEFIILSVNEGIGKLSNKVGTFTFKTKDGVKFDSSINGSHEFLSDLWKRKDELVGKEATVRYFNKTEDGSLRFPKVIDISRWEFE